MITECQIFLTRRCNLRCQYCRLTKISLKRELDAEEWKKAFKILEKIGIKTVKILGGEPTIVKDIEDLIIFLNKKTSLRYALLSNSMFDDKKLERLVRAGIMGYFASIDGIEDIKGVDGYEIAKSKGGYEKLLKLKRRGIKILGANVVITKKNLLNIPKIVKTLSNSGIWINLCSVIHGSGDFWQFRNEIPEEFKFSKKDIPLINHIMIKLLQMKLEGYRIAVPDSYLINMSKYGINCNWRCKELVQLRIDADGALMLCNDVRGEIAKKYNILQMDKKGFKEFKIDWKKERKRTNCPGCYWSCFLAAENNLKNNALEFDYINQEK